MSKYYKAEDVLAIFSEEERPLNWTDSKAEIQAQNDFDCYKGMIESLPTIEVSEDCISKHDIWKIIEDNAYWVRYNENSTEKGMTLTGINQALNECPPVIPTVSEDCISREWVKGICEFMLDEEMLGHMLGYIEEAPSVVPTTEQSSEVGEWIMHINELFPGEYTQECSICHAEQLTNGNDDNYCPNCGAKMKGAEE